MDRLHLLELEDQRWLPASIRNAITDFLQFAVSAAKLYRPFAPRLERAITASGATRVVDLCSGAGGPWLDLLRQIEPLRRGTVTVALTDHFPNHTALERLQDAADTRIDYEAGPVSAIDIPESLGGFRTLFSSFHHFRPNEAVAILADAVRSGQGIAIAESTQRHPLLMLYMLFTPVLVLLALPLQRPFRWSRLFWTYLVPVVPFAVMFDGLVSCLRTYTPDELLALVKRVDNADRYDWEAGIERIGRLPVGVTYLIGSPRPAAPAVALAA